MHISVVEVPNVATSHTVYPSSRPPLRPSPLVKLPLGAVRPRGWLKHQLDLMAEGMTGRLPELSQFLSDDCGWFGGEAEGWEEQPYWLRGFHDLAVLTGDEGLLAEAERWIDAVLGSQLEDGYFGPLANRNHVGQSGRGVVDLWPHMIAIDALISHHEHTGDERVIALLTRFFEYVRDMPEEAFLPTLGELHEEFGPNRLWWQTARAGDMLPHLHWLYNRGGPQWLLDLAARFFAGIAPPRDEWLDHHVVNFTQRFRYPGTYYAQSGERWHRQQAEYWLTQHGATWGQQPRGIFGADENIRPGCVDPRQGFETCGMTEFAKSFHLLGRVMGRVRWADRCEDVMLNHFPVASTPDLKALHYLTASNQPQLDTTEHHEYQNKGRQIDYSPHLYRCCQHNVAMGWPYYAQSLWQASADDGLVAWLYGASEVRARAGAGGQQAVIETETDYPFSGAVEMTIQRGAEFPLYLRVPGWATSFRVRVNDEPLKVSAVPGRYVRVERQWLDGDSVSIKMGMEPSLTEWPRTGSVTVDRGPLSYSLKIGERWHRCGGTDEWPEWEVLPTTAWNFGLAIDRRNPGASLKVEQNGTVADQPWTVDAAPVRITARGRRLPQWVLENQTCGELPRSPAPSDQPEEEITLIPMGCARLRIACFPVVGNGS